MSAINYLAPPRLAIGALQGRSGKTTVSLGLCLAFTRRGLTVQPFKKGPDYIDPSWLSAAAGRDCRNLDRYFLGSEERVLAAFQHGVRNSDLSLIEGNHGLYDSAESDGGGSTAALARILQTPILLVVNGTRLSRSAAAMVLGYQLYEPGTPIAGVILNNVANRRHLDKMRAAIEDRCRIPVLGGLPTDEQVNIPDRHLGLVPHREDAGLHPALLACADLVEKHLDLDQILKFARAAPMLELLNEGFSWSGLPPASQTHVRIGIPRDRVFTFYYSENLEALREAGAELVFFDSLSVDHLPEVDGLYLGGGFPEMFMNELEANHQLRSELRDAVENGMPVYAECGGLMLLSKGIHFNENYAAMAGALPIEVEMKSTPMGHGYVEATVEGENPFFGVGDTLRGHEFHHSRVLGRNDLIPVYQLNRGTGLGGQKDGLCYRNTLACYTHLHAGGAPGWAPSLVKRAAEFATRGGSG